MKVQVIRSFIGMKECNVSLWQHFVVKEIQIRRVTIKFPSEIKYYLCYHESPHGIIKFDYTEVREL